MENNACSCLTETLNKIEQIKILVDKINKEIALTKINSTNARVLVNARSREHEKGDSMRKAK